MYFTCIKYMFVFLNVAIFSSDLRNSRHNSCQKIQKFENMKNSSSNLCCLRSGVWMRVHERNLCEEFWEKFSDFAPYCPGSIFQLLGCFPARHHIMCINLDLKWHEKEMWCQISEHYSSDDDTACKCTRQ